MAGRIVALPPSDLRQVLLRCVCPAGIADRSLAGRPLQIASPPIGYRCVAVVPVASVASPVASALHHPKSVLKGTFQDLKRAVWREKSRRLAGLLPESPRGIP